MLTMLKHWTGKVEIDGVQYSSINDVPAEKMTAGSTFTMKLHTETHRNRKDAGKAKISVVTPKSEKRITVKAYMTRKASPEFDFMQKWNNDSPMPLRTMVGTIEKETRGMVYMNLHGLGEPVIQCLRCGKTLTNPVSRHYGIGPECMSKLGIVADIEDVDTIKEQLVNVKWSGWIIRSAILEQEDVE